MVIPLNRCSESDQDAVRKQLARILQSGPFLQSQRRQRFLEYIVTETLAGRGERLKGYNVALEVFGRPETFDPVVDPLVRIEAARLREKLREYYDSDGQRDPIRIELPKGSYVPQIELREAARLELQASPAGTKAHQPRAGPEPVALPDDRPSVAVLPFVNMSVDDAHDFLSDGITENIITGLSRFRDLSVIASHSTFAYKGRALKIQDVSRELGVRFVLEGSVQKSSGRVTITAQLIDALSGTHLWAERFDRDFDDITTVLDEVTELIVARLATAYGGRLHKAWRGRIEKSTPQNFQAYDHFQRGIEVFETHIRGCTDKARVSFLKAIELDPDYGKPYAKIAWAYLTDVWLGWSEDPARSMADALRYATLAIARDDDEAWGHWAMGGYHIFCGQHDRAIACYERAVDLNPNDGDVINDFGYCLSCAGRPKEGVEMVRRAMRLNPHYPQYWLMVQGSVYFDARQYEDAIVTLESLRTLDTVGVQLYLAAGHAALGHKDQARTAVTRVIEVYHQATVRCCEAGFLDVYKEPADREHLRENLLKAGLPE
jgi:adenylate cyclase